MTNIKRLLPTATATMTSRSAFLSGMTGVVAAVLAPGRANAATGLIIEGKGDWLFPAWESLTDAGTPGIASAIAAIATASRLLHAAGTEVLVAVVPMKARFYADRLPAGVALSAAVSARYAAILAGLTAADVPSFDIQAVLQASTLPLFFRTDYHWTEWSAEAVAQACAAKLQAMLPLPPSADPLPPLSPFAQDPHVGDLVALLPPERQKSIGSEPLTVRTIDASRVALLDSSKASVHVVGNSFSMPYLGFPEMLAETLRQPVGVTAKFGNAGPWQTMVQYLESPVFSNRRPRAIVWQFVEGLFMHGPAASGFWDLTSLMSEKTFIARVTNAVSKA